jgi:hypothetical protein
LPVLLSANALGSASTTTSQTSHHCLSTPKLPGQSNKEWPEPLPFSKGGPGFPQT